MLEYKGLQFNDTIKVLFTIKEKKGHKSLNETYKYLETEQLDAILDILLISYNLSHVGNELDDKGLGELFANKEIGFMAMAELYGQLMEKIMFSGMTKEEIEKRKNLAMNQKK